MNTNIRPIIIDLVDELRNYPDNWKLVFSYFSYRVRCDDIDIVVPYAGSLIISSTTSPDTHIELNGPENELVYKAALEGYNYLRDKWDRENQYRENQYRETEFLETALEKLKLSREEGYVE